MQLLVVHRDPEMGDALVQMMNNYTRHACDLVASDRAAMEWARCHKRCDLLLIELEADGIDGLALGSSVSEIFPALQILFFPNYPAAERRLRIAGTKIFPEPIEGDELLDAIERAENTASNSPDLFQVVDVLQMSCLSRRSGGLQLVKEGQSGLVFLRNGKMVHAETTHARGRDALRQIVNWEFIEFAYERSVSPPVETITTPWEDLLLDIVSAGRSENSVESRRSA